MKIALIGTHGTGKTTIAHELVAELKKTEVNVGLLEEVVRDCPLPVNEATSQEAQKWILFMQIAKEIELSNKYDFLVCDRSALDAYVYYFRKFGENKLLEEIIKEHLPTYNFLFKVPIRDFLKEDGFRSTDRKFQQEIEEKFDYLLQKLNVNFYPYKSVEDTINMVYKQAEIKNK